MDISGSSVLVTGGAGLIGSHIVDRLAEEDARRIVVFDDFSRGREENLADARARAGARLEIVRGDIADPAQVSAAMRGIDLVFHQAAIRIVRCAEEPRLAMRVLVDGTFNVLEAAAAAGVRKLVAASSASVYGLAESFPTTEAHHPYNNRTLYGAAKAFNEGLMRSFHDMYGLDWVGLRYFNVYGPRMDTHGAYTEVLIRWMERIAVGRSPVIFGDGTQTMDFVNAADIARANILAAKSDATDAVFNVASGQETSLKGLAEALLRAMDAEGLPIEYAAERKVNPVPRRLADTGAARRAIGFEARIGLEEGMRGLVAWWRAERRLADAA